jgi:ubiquinone biosynthesis protein
LGEAPIGKLIREMLAIVRRRHLQLPREISLLLKMVLMTEGMGVSLDPDFQLSEVVGPYAQRLVSNRYSPAAMMKHLADAGVDALELAANFPTQLRRFQAMLDAGGPEVHLRAQELDPLVTRLETMVQRIVLGMVAAAFMRGVGDIVTASPGRRGAWELPLLGATVGTAGTLTAWLAFSVRRKR